jgi:hypothetical protein
MNNAIRWFLDGGGYDSDYQAWLTQIIADGGTQPSASVKTAQNAFFVGLKAASLWSRAKAGWFLHAGDKTTCRRNFVSPANYRMTEVNTLTFSEGNGCRSDGSSSCWNTTYPANAYVGIQNDLTTVGLITESSTTTSAIALFGTRVATASDIHAVNPRNGSQGFNYRSTATAFTSANTKALYIDTYDGTNKVIYRDGVKTSTVTTPVAPTISAPYLLLARNINASTGVTPTEYCPYYLGLFMLFDRFNDTDESTLRGLITTYRTAAGLP